MTDLENDYPGIELDAKLRCPYCDTEHDLRMPIDQCRWFLECIGCKVILIPLPGDCCVFCSFADHNCPPVQMGVCCDR